MALAETAELAVKLSLGGNFLSQMGKVNRSLQTFDKSASRGYRAGQQIGTGIKRGAAIAVGGVAILASQVALGLDSLIKLEQATAQTNAVIKSTGGAAKTSAAEVRTLAEKYEALNAVVGDELIQSGENLLLTFTNIGKKAFEPALATALDMNTALGRGPEGLTQTVKQLGKALNDPTKGLSALSRVGVTFTADQTKRIKQLQKEGKLYEAQGVILAELNKRFGGSFIAQGNTTAGRVAKFTDSIEDLQRALATALLPTIGNIADALTSFLADPQTVRDVEDLGKQVAKLFSPENIRAGLSALKDGFTFLKSVAGPIADVVGTAVKAFTSLPPDIQKLLVGGFAVNKLTGGLVTNIAGGIFGALKAMTVQAAVVNVNGGVVSGGGGAAGAVGATGGKAGLLSKALSVGAIVAGVAAVIETQQQVSGNNTAIAAGVKQGLDQSIATQSLRDLKVSLAATNTGIANITSNPLYTFVQGDALATLKTMQADLQKQIGQKEAVEAARETKRETAKGLALLDGKVSKLTSTTSTKGDANKTATERAKSAIDGAKRATEFGATRNVSATNQGASMVASAVRQSRPIITTNIKVNVSAAGVSKSITQQSRYGPGNGSHGGGTGLGGIPGGGGR